MTVDWENMRPEDVEAMRAVDIQREMFQSIQNLMKSEAIVEHLKQVRLGSTTMDFEKFRDYTRNSEGSTT